MEQTRTFHFDEADLETLESALAMYAAYTKIMEVDMLVGDESDADEVCANHNRAKSMHREVFGITHDKTYEQEREDFAEIHDRPMDLSDFSDFDWFDHQRGD